MATFNKFNVLPEHLAEKVHNLGADTLKVMLSNTAPSASNSLKSDITEISAGNGYTAGGNTLTAIGCYFAGNAGANMRNVNGAGTLTAHNCIFNGGTYGIQDATGSAVTFDVRHSVFFQQSSGGILLGSTGNKTTRLLGNVFYGITGYGFENQGSDKNNWLFQVANLLNAYGSNSSGPRGNYPAGYGDVSLTADPFTDSTNADFNLNNTAGGGAALRAVTYTMSG